MDTVFIYALIDPRTDKVRYIGKTNNTKERLRSHIKDARYENTHKANWIMSLLRLGTLPAIEILDTVPAEDWEFFERGYIRIYRELGAELTNGTDGGDRVVFTPEIREKISKAIRGKKKSPEHVAKMSASKRGSKHKLESREKISKALKGRKFSEEHREKISISKLGYVFSPEVIARRSETRRKNTLAKSFI